ncbi:uncharacterized protein [Porites lutea]|uniref:uncharacterized protein n=1 Tax=Porites lutea TaxID=51062 RepID=UPI003CC6745F
MESGAITDDKISASSKVNAGTPAKNGRLNYVYGSSWCASPSDKNPYLEIDLGVTHIICAVSTQGNSRADEWVKTYTLQFYTGGAWTNYEEDGQVKIFAGNIDRNTEKKNILFDGMLTGLLRFVGTSSHNRFCLRAEVYGVKFKPENIAAGKPTNQSSTYKDRSASGESFKAVDGNSDTHFPNGHCSHTLTDNPSWWSVDLGADHLPVFEVRIVNRFSTSDSIRQRNNGYKITLGNSSTVTSNSECIGRYSFIHFIASAVCYNNPLKTGRYVGIMTTKQQLLQLCEVEIYSRENMAFRKHTDQSSYSSSSDDSYKAVDGNSNTSSLAGLCSLTNLELNPWWRVDLGRKEPVSEVYVVNSGGCCTNRLNPFEIRVGENSSRVGTANPKCGDSTYSVPTGQGVSFYCRPSLYGRYVTIRLTKSSPERLTLCEVEVYSARRASQIQRIGLASSYEFPSNRFSASSSTVGNEAFKGRLNGNGAWSPSTDSAENDYLQIDLKNEFFISAVATQGNPAADHWTTKYKLHMSVNNTQWDTYQENGVDKIFHANGGRSDIVKNNLVNISRAKFVRFQPTEFFTRKALRVELYGILKPSVPSQPPANLTVAASTSTSISASWMLPPEDPMNRLITGFKVFFKKKDSLDAPTVVIINGVLTFSKNLSGLNKYTEYEFSVLAFTSAGDGPKTSIKVQRTKEDVPSKAPSSFTVTASTSTSIVASWHLPREDSRNGIITGYKLFYIQKGSTDPPLMQVSDRAELIKVVTGLKKNTEYEFQVLAFTSVGDGPKSSVVVERTNEDVPSQAPTSFNVSACTSTSIDASWNLPPAISRNGIITGFKLFYKRKEFHEPPTIIKISNAVIHTKTVTGLDKYAVYEFQVLAFNSAGDGPKSSVIVQRTREDAPSQAPINFTVIAQSSSSILASWQLPPLKSRNGIITGFKLFYKRQDQFGEANITININSATTRREIISRLEKYTEYVLQILAFTSAGDGPRSSKKVTRTKEGDPPIVRKLQEKTIVMVGDLTLLSCEVSGVPEPLVIWSKDGDNDITRARLKNKGRVLVIEDVIPGDRGVYECKASNKFGENRTATTVIVAVPPRVKKDASSSSVICKRQTLCLLSCTAASDFPVTYSWTKNGQILRTNGNGTISLKPRDTKDYGVYVCNVTNKYGSAVYNITVSEFQKTSVTARRTKTDSSNKDNAFRVTVPVLSCVVVLLLIVTVVLLWRLRHRPVHDSILGQHMSKAVPYMELDELSCQT